MTDTATTTVTRDDPDNTGPDNTGPDDHTADDSATGDATGESGGTTDRPGTRKALAAYLRPKRLIPAIAFLLVAASAVFFGLNYAQLRSAETDRQQALRTGTQILTNMASFDYKHLNKNIDAVTADASDGFRPQYVQLVQKLRNTITQAKATSTPKVVASGVSRIDDSRADLVYFLDTTVTNVQVKAPRVDPWRANVTLVKQHGAWKLDGLSFM